MLEESYKDSNKEGSKLPEADRIVLSGDDAFFEDAWVSIESQIPRPSKAVGLGWLALGVLLLLSPFVEREGTIAPTVEVEPRTEYTAQSKEKEDLQPTAVQAEEEVAVKEETDFKSTEYVSPVKPDPAVSHDDVLNQKMALAIGNVNLVEAEEMPTAANEASMVQKSDQMGFASLPPRVSNLTQGLPALWANLQVDETVIHNPSDIVFSSNRKLPRVWIGAYIEYGQNQWLGESNTGNYHSVNYELTSGYTKEAGIKMAIPIAKDQSVELRMGYGIQRLAAHYDLSVDYGSSGEYSDGMGHLHRNYDHTLNTLIGEMDLKHVLYRKETDRLQEGETVGFTLSIEQDLEIIPIGISYLYDVPLTRSLFAQGGLGLDASYFRNQVQGTRIGLKSHHNMMHHNYSEINAQTTHTAQPWMVAATVSVGLGYEWKAYRFVLNAQIQETIIEPELNLGAHLHPTLLTGSFSVLRAF